MSTRAWLLVCCLPLCAATGLAQPRPQAGGLSSQRLQAGGLSGEMIAGLAAQLESPRPERRERAIEALSTLGPESLPGIAARLDALGEARPEPEAARQALTEFRHAVGSRRADDSIDIAPGVAPVLAKQRGRDTIALAEPLLLLRSLERIATREAGLLLPDVFLLDRGVWSHESRRVRDRMGLSLLPALIELRSHADRRIKRWAQHGVRELGMEAPERVAKLEDASLLAAAVEAYGRPLDFAAMPTIVRLVGSDQVQVRLAARRTVARFGKNAIWQLRELYEEVTARPASKRWGTERTRSELYKALDASRTQAASARLSEGEAHLEAGRLQQMQRAYDRLLSDDPFFARRAELAPGYAKLGQALLAEGQLERARDAYSRALRLAPGSEAAPRARAQIAFIDGERALAAGIVDLAAYRGALEHDPEHAAAADAHDRLSGRRAARRRTLRRWAALGAVACLLVLSVLLARWRAASAQPARRAVAD